MAKRRKAAKGARRSTRSTAKPRARKAAAATHKPPARKPADEGFFAAFLKLFAPPETKGKKA